MKRIPFPNLIKAFLCLVGLFLAGCLCPEGLPAAAGEPPQLHSPKHAQYRMVIHCGMKVLQLWQHEQMVREYPIDIGMGGLGKKRSGDHRTPVGDYEITWMASRQSNKGHRIIENKSWCIGNKFVYSATGPGLEKLWAESYGGPQATVMSINYPNEKEKKQGYTGECIHIHADRRVLDGALKKSYGCIHMFPRDAMELYEIVDVGTPVKILP